MSLPILLTTDFETGTVKISTTRFQAGDLGSYITEFEQRYIKMLLNDLMFTEIRDQSPLHSKYTALIDGADWVDSQGITHVMRGFKEALKRFVYWQYGKDYFLPTVIGKGRNLNENADNLTPGENQQVINTRFNEAVNIYDEAIEFVEFYGNIDGVIDSVVESPAGTYTVNTSSTLYLEDNDIVTIGGVDYTVGSLIVDTSFVITGAAGLTLGDEYTYKPFKDPNLNYISLQWL